MTPDSTEVTVLLRDPDGYILLASDADVPSGEAGYAVGCIFIDTDASGVSNIFLVNEGSTTSCSFVTATASTTFNALTDTNLNPATATAGTVPCVVGGVLTAKAGLVFGTTTATSGNVLVANGTTWGTSTPDSAGLVATTGNQTVAGNKTFSGSSVFSGTIAANSNVTLADSMILYLGDTTSYLTSPSAGTVELKSKLTSGGLMTIDGYGMALGANSAGGITLGAVSGAGALSLLFTGNFTCYGAAASTMNFGAAAQTGTMTYGETSGSMTANFFSGTGANTVNFATGAGAKVVTVGSTNGASSLTLAMGTGNFSLAGVAASTITIGKTDQTGDILLGQSTGANEVKIATGNGNKTLTMVTGTGTNTVNLCTGTGTDTVSIASGAGAKVVTLGSTTGASSLTLAAGTGNISMAGVAATTITIGKSDQTGKISIGDSTGALTIDVGVGGTAVKTVNIANEATQVHVINIGGTNSLPTLTGTTVTVAAGTLFDVNGDADISGDLNVQQDIDASGSIEAEKLNQTKMYWCDDFMETAADLASTVISKVYWTGGGTSGTQAIAADANGVMQLSTTATGSRSSTLTYSGASTFDNDLAWIFEARVKVNNITNTKIDLGMYVDGNDEIIFRFDTDVDAGNIYLVTENNNGGEILQDTGVNLTANTYFKFRIEVEDDDTFEVSINDTEVCSVPTGTIRDVAFKPYFYVDNKAAAEEKILSIDYVKVWQDRSAT